MLLIIKGTLDPKTIQYETLNLEIPKLYLDDFDYKIAVHYVYLESKTNFPPKLYSCRQMQSIVIHLISNKKSLLLNQMDQITFSEKPKHCASIKSNWKSFTRQNFIYTSRYHFKRKLSSKFFSRLQGMIGFNKSYQKRFTKKWSNLQIGAGTAKRRPRLIKLKSRKSKKRSSLKKKYQELK